MDNLEWMAKLFQSVDAFDVDGFMNFLTDDATFKYANAEPVIGKTAICDGLKGLFASIKGIHHNISEVWADRDAVICRGEVTYTRHDQSKLTLPFANIFKMKGGLIKEYLIYVDASQLHA